MSCRPWIVTPLLLVGPFVAPCHAQMRWEITTHTGLLQPTGYVMTVVEERSIVLETNPADTSTTVTVARFRQEPDLVVGGRLTLWLSERLGLEAAVLYSFSDVEIRTEMETDGQQAFLDPGARSLDANLASGSLRALWRIQRPGPVSFDLGVGLGFLRRTGEAFERLDGTTDLSVVAGGGMRVEIAPKVALRVGLEDYVSFAGFSDPPLPDRSREGNFTPTPEPELRRESGIQNDLVLIQALTVALGP